MRRKRVPWWRSLRLPIAVVVALSAVISALVIGYVADQSATTAGLHRLRAEAGNQLSAADATYEFTGDLANGTVLAVTEAGLKRTGVPANLIQSAQREPGHRVVTYFSGATMWAARALDEREVLATQVPADSLARERDHLHQWFLTTGLVLLLIAFAGGWLVAGPITGRLRRAARWVEVGALDQAPEFLRTRRPDEVDELVAGIDQLSTTLRDRVRTEQTFTADVAHELRTPLTALVSAASLLPSDNTASELVRQQVTRLRLLIDDLLELARADQADEPIVLEPVNPVTMVERLARQLPELAPHEVVIDSPAPVVADPRRLERILVNLLANGHRHGAGPVVVTFSGARVVVRDSGPGYPEELLISGPQRLRALGRTAGSGLGLALSETYSGQIGATLTLANAPGAVATLRLRPG